MDLEQDRMQRASLTEMDSACSWADFYSFSIKPSSQLSTSMSAGPAGGERPPSPSTRQEAKRSMLIKREIEALETELVDLRRDLHRHPELGFQEVRTSGIVADYLKACGLEVRTGVARTGVVGLLRGNHAGRTVLLRADMDALPVQEQNEVPYRSVHDGKMHACGHDGHTAMLLVAAKILARHKDSLRGNIKFVFQPNEEDAGARQMVDEGVLEDPHVDAALGLHLWSQLETGRLGIAPGPIMASSDYFKLTVTGQGGHGGAPHTSVDPVICAAAIIQSVQSIQTREIDALKPTVITFCKVNCGTSPIIVPDRIVLEGSIRCLYDGAEDVKERFRRMVESMCSVYRTTYELKINCGNILLSNDPDMTDFISKVAGKVVGPDHIETNIRMMVGEDFAEFNKDIPGAFYFVGTGNKGKGTCYPHHHPRFNMDEDSLPIGVEMHATAALEFLQD
ncbi:MAG: amidohydrolase [Holophaga sp.]